MCFITASIPTRSIKQPASARIKASRSMDFTRERTIPNTCGASRAPCGNHRRALQKALAGRTVFQVDQTEPPHQAFLRYVGERRENANLDGGLRLCARRDVRALRLDRNGPRHLRKAQSNPCIFRMSQCTRWGFGLFIVAMTVVVVHGFWF